jgi:hypothetical protein
MVWPDGLAGWFGRMVWPDGLAGWFGRMDWMCTIPAWLKGENDLWRTMTH